MGRVSLANRPKKICVVKDFVMSCVKDFCNGPTGSHGDDQTVDPSMELERARSRGKVPDVSAFVNQSNSRHATSSKKNLRSCS